MAWVYLIIAGLFEIAWAVGLKSTEGFSKLYPSIGVIALICLSLFLLSRAVITLPVGTAYAIWTGIGAAGTAILGISFLGESSSPSRLICIGLIILGVIGLKISSSAN